MNRLGIISMEYLYAAGILLFLVVSIVVIVVKILEKRTGDE